MAEKSIEQFLVESLGATITGRLEKLGEFLVEDGEDFGSSFVECCEGWLRDKRLLGRKDEWSFSTMVSGTNRETISIRVWRSNDCVEYRFTPAEEPKRKHFHLIEAKVFIPAVGNVS